MWNEVHPDIFVKRLFSQAECERWLKRIAEQPRDRREAPNSMNKYGIVLGGSLRPALADLVQYVVSPKAVWYPDIRPLKKHPYAFSIDYSVKTQKSLAAHHDSSDVTLNVCLGKKFTGGDLVFGSGRKRFVLKHEVGQAVIHRGSHVHRAMPLLSGERTNLILWCAQRKSRGT